MSWYKRRPLHLLVNFCQARDLFNNVEFLPNLSVQKSNVDCAEKYIGAISSAV